MQGGGEPASNSGEGNMKGKKGKQGAVEEAVEKKGKKRKVDPGEEEGNQGKGDEDGKTGGKKQKKRRKEGQNDDHVAKASSNGKDNEVEGQQPIKWLKVAKILLKQVSRS